VFGIMVLATAVLALFGYLKVRRIRGPRETIASVKETREVLTSTDHRADHRALSQTAGRPPASGPGAQTDPSGW
jgi:hypothetical protein